MAEKSDVPGAHDAEEPAPRQAPAEDTNAPAAQPLAGEKGRASGLGQAGTSNPEEDEGIASSQGGGIEGAVGGGQSGQGGG